MSSRERSCVSVLDVSSSGSSIDLEQAAGVREQWASSPLAGRRWRLLAAILLIFVKTPDGAGRLLEEPFALGCQRQKVLARSEDGHSGGLFDVLAVAHQDGFVDPERGGRGSLGAVVGHAQYLADVLDAVSTGAGSDDG